MSRIPELALAVLAGLILGALFYGGLRWSSSRGLASRSPALWFVFSLWLRLALVGAGLLAIFRVNFGLGVAACAGIVIARPLIVRGLPRARIRPEPRP